MSIQCSALVASFVVAGALAGAMVCPHAADEASAQTADGVSNLVSLWPEIDG